MDNTNAQDAARYRWIKAQQNLALRTNITYGAPWTKTDTGEKYYPSHQLDVNGTGFNGIEHFDDLIDQAMEMYPFMPEEITQEENEQRLKDCLEQIRNLTHADLVKLMGKQWIEDYRRHFS